MNANDYELRYGAAGRGSDALPTLLQDSAYPLGYRGDTPPKGAPRPKASHCSKENTLIVFDWDDTFFPTSALERNHLLVFPPPRLRPQVQEQLEQLAEVCHETLCIAERYGTVIIITNSAPGWLDASCLGFMPSLHQKIKSYPIFAKPFTAPLTFKNEVFRREGMNYSNVVSVGDGIAERTATKRLIAERRTEGRVAKSLKFKDLPTVKQLVDQLELTQARLENLAGHNGHLDLRTNFAPPGRSIGQSSFGASKTKIARNCWLSHMTQFASSDSDFGGSSRSLSGGSSSSTNLESAAAMAMSSPFGGQLRSSTDTRGSMGGGNNGGYSSLSAISPMLAAQKPPAGKSVVAAGGGGSSSKSLTGMPKSVSSVGNRPAAVASGSSGSASAKILSNGRLARSSSVGRTGGALPNRSLRMG